MTNTFRISPKNLEERSHLGDIGVDDKIILKTGLKEIECEGVGCIYLAEYIV
jgi:hypothetical protein